MELGYGLVLRKGEWLVGGSHTPSDVMSVIPNIEGAIEKWVNEAGSNYGCRNMRIKIKEEGGKVYTYEYNDKSQEEIPSLSVEEILEWIEDLLRVYIIKLVRMVRVKRATK